MKNNTSKYYKYKTLTILKTILKYNKIKKLSDKTFSQYQPFCHNYPRHSYFDEKQNKMVAINSYQSHIEDISKKKFTFKTFNEKQIEKKNLKINNENISCLIVRNESSNKWVIGLHGWTEDKYLALRQVWHFWNARYNIITFDSYAHGDSYGEYTDIGYSSLVMTEAVVDYLKHQEKAKHIGMIGNSMGASSSILFAQSGRNKNLIDWVIADCGFNSIKLQYRYYVENNFSHQNWWKTTLGFIPKFNKLTKTNQNKFDLTKNMKASKSTPIFFIHSKKDTFVPSFMSEEMFKLKIKYEKKVISEIWTPNDFEHVMVLPGGFEEYVKKLLILQKRTNYSSFFFLRFFFNISLIKL